MSRRDRGWSAAEPVRPEGTLATAATGPSGDDTRETPDPWARLSLGHLSLSENIPGDDSQPPAQSQTADLTREAAPDSSPGVSTCPCSQGPGATHHDVVGLHGLHGGQEFVLRLLVLLAVLEREVGQAFLGLQQPHRQAWGHHQVRPLKVLVARKPCTLSLRCRMGVLSQHQGGRPTPPPLFPQRRSPGECGQNTSPQDNSAGAGQAWRRRDHDL